MLSHPQELNFHLDHFISTGRQVLLRFMHKAHATHQLDSDVFIVCNTMLQDAAKKLFQRGWVAARRNSRTHRKLVRRSKVHRGVGGGNHLKLLWVQQLPRRILSMHNRDVTIVLS